MSNEQYNMIGALKGTIYSKSQNSIILFVGGVGYSVFVTNKFLEESKIESEAFLFIHSHIREDAFDLFGFPTKQELHVFKLLITVSGIGPKTALTVINRGVGAVTGAVQKSDVEFFTTIPRLGKKNAQKIIIELKQKLGSIADLDLSEYASSETKEILDGLSSMGFARNEAMHVIKTIPSNTVTLEQKIRYCLKELGKTA
jgi:Holliday junction DNA helicase RuvA